MNIKPTVPILMELKAIEDASKKKEILALGGERCVGPQLGHFPRKTAKTCRVAPVASTGLDTWSAQYIFTE